MNVNHTINVEMQIFYINSENNLNLFVKRILKLHTEEYCP